MIFGKRNACSFAPDALKIELFAQRNPFGSSMTAAILM